MRKQILISLFLCFSAMSCFAQDEFIDLRGNTFCIDSSKVNYFIVLSSVSCHKCYLDVQDYLLQKGYYSQANTVINIICIDSKENISTAIVRKSLYNTAKEYFPQANNIIYHPIDETNSTIFETKIDQRGIPIVFLWKKEKIVQVLQSSK